VQRGRTLSLKKREKGGGGLEGKRSSASGTQIRRTVEGRVRVGAAAEGEGEEAYSRSSTQENLIEKKA